MFSKIHTTFTGSALAFGLIAATAIVAPTGQAQAQAVQACAAVNGLILPVGGDVSISVSPGDVITTTAAVGLGESLTQDRSPGVVGAPTVAFDGPFVVPAGVSVLGVIASFGAGSPFAVTCTPGAGGSAFIDTQTGAIQTAVAQNTQGRLRGTGPANRASVNGVFLSTSNLPGAQNRFGQPEVNGWLAVDARRLDGATTGSSVDITVGVDRLLSTRLLVGALVAYGRQDTTTGATRAQVNSPAIGGYFAAHLQGDWLADGYLALARPAYDVNGATFTASRVSAALGISGNYQHGGLDISPFAKMNASSEAQPANGAVAANTVTNLKASVGGRIEPLAALQSGVLPYISVAVDYGMNDSTAGGRDTFFAPRLGLGFSMALGGGFLNVDMDGGRIRSNVTDLGVRATYEMSF